MHKTIFARLTQSATFLTLLPQLIFNDMQTPRSGAEAPARRANIVTPLTWRGHRSRASELLFNALYRGSRQQISAPRVGASAPERGVIYVVNNQLR
jgi:hypothetical protein